MKIKYIVAFMLTFVMLCGCSNDKKFEILESDFRYEENSDGSITIKEYVGPPMLTNLIIPSSINGKTVTSIGYGAFKDFTYIKNVVVPDCISKIEAKAFSGTPWLAEKQKENPLVVVNGILIDGTAASGDVIIPDGVKTISDGAFEHCRNITNITFPSSVKKIGRNAFDDTAFLENKQKESPLVIINGILVDGTTAEGSISVPDNVTSIGDGAFAKSNVRNITLPNSVTSIGDSAFGQCYSLKNISMTNSISYIGEYAFCFCWSLSDVTIPDGVTTIREATFAQSNLHRVTIPKSVKTIEKEAFEDCVYLEEVNLTSGLLSIGHHAFCRCEALTSLIIPDTVSSIGSYAFASCDNLTSIIIPDGVTLFGEGAFSNCSKIQISYDNTIYNCEQAENLYNFDNNN